MKLPLVERFGVGLLVLPCLAAVLGITGCTFDYTAGEVESRRREEVPQVELINVRMVVERDNRLELTAERIAVYRERRTQEFSGVFFQEFDTAGELRLEGRAERGVLDLDTEDVELFGEIRFYSRPDEAALESSFLSWNNADRILAGEPDGEVLIRRDDGSWVQGAGVRVDGRRNRVEFTGGLTGEFRREPVR